MSPSPGTEVASRIRRGFQLFVHVGDLPRARRATDVILLLVSLIGVALGGVIAVPEPGFAASVRS